MDKEAQERIAQPPTGKVGNLSGDEYSLSCIRCGSIKDLHQIAFRNINKRVIGYVFACRGCEPLIFDKSLAEILGYHKLPEGEPPLLRQGGIDKIAHDTKDEAVVYGWDLQKSMDTMVDRFLTAQRDSDIKWIRGE